MKIGKMLILVLLISLLYAGSARADGVFNPTDDTYVDLNDPTPTSPPGKNGYRLLVDYSYQPSFVITRRAYLRFDISALDTDADNKSQLILYTLGAPFNTIGNLAVWSTGDDWNGATAGIGDETTLNWANAPALISKLNTQPAGSSGSEVTFLSTELGSYITSQRSANGGDNLVSFVIQWDSCSSCGLFDDTFFEDSENSGGSGHPPELIVQGPTAVTLSSFTADPVFKDIRVSWETVSEVHLVGFNLLRATERNGTRILLNTSPIPAKATGKLIGRQYSYLDSTVQPGVTYYYWLELIETSGADTPTGPEKATGQYTIFLSLVKKSNPLDITGFLAKSPHWFQHLLDIADNFSRLP